MTLATWLCMAAFSVLCLGLVGTLEVRRSRARRRFLNSLRKG